MYIIDINENDYDIIKYNDYITDVVKDGFYIGCTIRTSFGDVFHPYIPLICIGVINGEENKDWLSPSNNPLYSKILEERIKDGY